LPKSSQSKIPIPKDIKKEEPQPKEPTNTKKNSKTVEKFRSRLSQYGNKPATTVCTQDDMLHIDEFIKVISKLIQDELRDLNSREL
jgi:hypothetical protein